MAKANTTKTLNEGTPSDATSGVPTATPPVGQGFDGSGTRSAMMSTVMNTMATMPHSQMIDFFNQVMTQFGPNRIPGEVDNSKQNQASIAAKGSPLGGAAVAMGGTVKEDLQTIFANDETLSEEFKTKATTLFEAAVTAAISSEVVRLQEEHDAKIQEEVETFKEEVSSKVDDYLTFVAEKWLEENKLAIEEGLKVEVTQDFINGLKKLFVESYIEVPEERKDLVKELEEKVATLEGKLNEAVVDSVNSKKQLQEINLNNVKAKVSAGLTLLQAEKFNTLAESVEATDDLVEFEKKLNIIKESFFKTPVSTGREVGEVEGVIAEEVTGNNATAAVDGSVRQYSDYISKTTKR